jgi:hypothetical protein
VLHPELVRILGGLWRHLLEFIVEVVNQLELARPPSAYRRPGWYLVRPKQPALPRPASARVWSTADEPPTTTVSSPVGEVVVRRSGGGASRPGMSRPGGRMDVAQSCDDVDRLQEASQRLHLQCQAGSRSRKYSYLRDGVGGA